MNNQPLSTPFPPPPEYYKQFTQDYHIDPPNRPKDNEEYICFGLKTTVDECIQTLQELNITQLFPSTDNYKLHLLNLNKELLKTFLEMLNVLTSNPQEYLESTNRLKLVLINLFYLCNLYRGIFYTSDLIITEHQARDILEHHLSTQLEKKKKIIFELKNAQASVLEKF
jgi:hypothetical protein